MENREDIQSEILGISPAVATIGNANTYSVPHGYFTNLADKILSKVKEEFFLPAVASPLQAPPANYFEGLAGNIMAKIKTTEKKINEVSEELETVAPLLNTISKQNIYAVPDGYFANFSVNITAAQPAPAKVVSFGSRSRKWVAYAAAAVLSGIVITGAYLFMNRDASNVQHGQQSAVTSASQNVSALSDVEITHYLNTEPEVDIASASFELNNLNTDIKTFLNNVSDEEIQYYLQSNKDPGEKPIKGI